ncbi:MAG: hypothetical protein N3H31_02810 [Candidatus Nezhaarchaeota archaeon]|nr:hypothetical protein [Candidatus Nezhaarchaeota archaeon]
MLRRWPDMVTHRDVANIIKRVKETSAKVRVVFEGLRYVLVINGFVKAEGLEGDKVEWSRAFGSLTPAEALASIPIKFIEVSLPNQSIIFKSLKELIKWAL